MVKERWLDGKSGCNLLSVSPLRPRENRIGSGLEDRGRRSTYAGCQGQPLSSSHNLRAGAQPSPLAVAISSTPCIDQKQEGRNSKVEEEQWLQHGKRDQWECEPYCASQSTQDLQYRGQWRCLLGAERGQRVRAGHRLVLTSRSVFSGSLAVRILAPWTPRGRWSTSDRGPPSCRTR